MTLAPSNAGVGVNVKMFLCSEGGKIRNRRNFVACAGPGEGRLSTPLLPFIDLTLEKTAGWVA